MNYGYIRVSSDKQTVENQRFEINNFCERERLHIDGWIEETISGTKSYNKRELGKLLSFGIERLEQTGKEHIVNGEKIKARKKTNNKWFETQDSISYLEDFVQPKIVWAELARTGNAFVIDTNKHMISNTAYMLVIPGNNVNILQYMLAFLNSRAILFYMDTICSRFDDNGWRWLNQFVSLLPIPKYKHDISIIDLVNNIDSMNQQSNSLEINNFVNQIFGFTKGECELLNKRFEKY